MYIIADAKIASRFDKEEALAEVAKLNRDKPGSDYKLYVPAVDNAPEKLELLYGLTIQLLKVGKVNPIFIKIEKTNLLGETEEFTARQIINDARAYMDTLAFDELIDKLNAVADKCLDPMVKAKLHAIVETLR